jgi:hypothetical protein
VGGIQDFEERKAFDESVDANIRTEFSRWARLGKVTRIWEHLGYERWAIGLARYLFPDFAEILRQVIWAELLYEQRYRSTSAPVRTVRKDARRWSSGVIADFAKLEGFWAVCAPPMWNSIRTLGEVYRDSATKGGERTREIRTRIEREMEAFGRALVTVKGRKGARDRKPRKPRSRRASVAATEAEIYRRQREIEKDGLPRGGVKMALEERAQATGEKVETLRKRLYRHPKAKNR